MSEFNNEKELCKGEIVDAESKLQLCSNLFNDTDKCKAQIHKLSLVIFSNDA